MEVRRRKGPMELSIPKPPKPVGTVALRNFTIPRKKRVSEQVHLEACPEDSRDYNLIQTKLRESRWDMRKEHASTFLWKDVKLVHNDGFLKEFSEKRSEMRSNGRHVREMEEHFCFLVGTYEETNQIYQLGLKTGSQGQYWLGKPSDGVYLFKHVDVALNQATASPSSGKHLIVFKVLFGKVKKVTPSLECDRAIDPTLGFDCHMAKDIVSNRDCVSQQVMGSTVFLFDYNQNRELNKRPRQCLPYAVVSFGPTGSAAAPLSTSPPVSPSKPPAGLTPGPLENLKGCTVAKRTGKGDNAIVTFKRYTTQGCRGVGYQSIPIPKAQPIRADATALQYNNLQARPSFNPHPSDVPYYDTAEYLNPSLLYYDSGISRQSYCDNPAFTLHTHTLTTTGDCGGNTDTVHETSEKNISTIVYSSRLVKDPRLSRQETSIRMKSAEEERASSFPGCTKTQACRTQSQEPREENEFSLSCEKQPFDLDEEREEGRFLEPSLDDASKPNATAQPKSENMPSIKLFKMNFQKYAPYFKMTEEERHREIWSKGNLTPEQKRLLTDRVRFYELHHQRYKQGLLFQKDTKTALGLSRTDSQNSEVCSTTHPPSLDEENQCEVPPSRCVSGPNLTATTVLPDSVSNKVDIPNTDTAHAQGEERGNSPDFQTGPQGLGVVQCGEETERIPETLLLQAGVQSNPSESAQDFTESLCPSIQASRQEVYENGGCTSPEENLAHKPELRDSVEDYCESEQHINMEVANYVDILATVLECEFCPYTTELEPCGHSKRCTEKRDRETSPYPKSRTNPDMSIEVGREESQQQNTVYKSLYERLQFDQLLSSSNEANYSANKSYLRLKGLEQTPALKSPYQVNEPKEEDLRLMFKSSQTSPKGLTLSERFSKLTCHRRKLAAFVCATRLNNSYATHLSGDLKSKPDALVSTSNEGKGTRNSNAKLIQCMAQRYNGNRFKANCKRLGQKRSKVLCRKGWSARSKRAVHMRKNHLLKAKRKRTNLASCGQSPCSLTSDVLSDHVGKGSNSNPKSAAASQCQSGPLSLLNDGSIQNPYAAGMSEEASRADSDSRTRDGQELSEAKEQYVNPIKHSTEMVCDVSKTSNHNEIRETEGHTTLDSDNLSISKDATEGDTETKTLASHQEQSPLVTGSGSHKSSGSAERSGREVNEEALLTLKLPQGDHRDPEEISCDYNTGAYKDTRSPVSCIPGDITSSSMISSSTATALTPDSPKVINNAANTQTEARVVRVNAVDNSGGVSNTNKSDENYLLCGRKDRELRNNPESTDANEKSIAGQNCANADITGIFTHKPKPVSKQVLGSQYQPPAQHTKSTGVMTSDFQDAQKGLTGTKEDPRSAWQERDRNKPPTSDTQIMSNLGEYFEFTVQKRRRDDISIAGDHAQVPWITLDSTAHKPIISTINYSKQSLADVTHTQVETEPPHITPNQREQRYGDSQPNSPVSKRRRASVLERVSPDSTFTETVQNEANFHLVHKDTQPYSTGGAETSSDHWLQNHDNQLQNNQIIYMNSVSAQPGNGSRGEPCQINRPNEQSTCEQVYTTHTQTHRYSVTDISSTLKLADRAVSMTELGSLRIECNRMLQHFVSNFEKDQKVSFQQSCITTNVIMEQVLHHPPLPVELKFEAINSFLELQMITEACQFVDNKINFLKGQPTFRSLLWYDPSLYSELYKGAVGFQQQSSLFSSFQQGLSSNEYRSLQEYYCAVSTLHQQLQDSPDTSYYMYLKTKRERLELEAAFRNPADAKNFFLSVPTAIMINLGDHLDVLKKTYNIVMTFIETPADQLPGTFDVGKAEHLSIICRYLHEKILYLKSHKEMGKISWFGMEHLLYDASKILVWRESEHLMPNEVLRKYKRLSSQTAYGTANNCAGLVNKIDQSPQPVESLKMAPLLQTSAIPPVAASPEKSQPAPNIRMEDGKKETHQPPARRAMQPLFIDGASSFIQPGLAAQHGSWPMYNDFTQRKSALDLRIHRNLAWDWSPPNAIQSTSHTNSSALVLSESKPTAHTKPGTTSLTDLQNNRGVRPQKISKPLIVKPRPVDRRKAPPIISVPQHQQVNQFNRQIMPPFPFQCFSPDAPPVVPPPVPPLTFSSISNQVALHNNPTQIHYPYYVFNGETYSTTGSSVPVSASYTETQYNHLPWPI